MSDHPFADLSSFVAMPRLTGLALSLDGTRLVASVQEPDAKGAKYSSALWEIPLGDGAPARLTRSEQGETAPAFLPDGSLLFVSDRPDPDGAEDEAELWLLPIAGEPRVVARSAGGVGGPVVAADSGAIALSGSRLIGSTDAADDAARRKDRKDRKISAILHTGMPIRHWDHELGDVSPRLLHIAAIGTEPRDLTPDAGFALTEAAYTISADGRTIATTWRERERGGRMPYAVSVLDVGTGVRRVLAAGKGEQYAAPAISPDGRRVALIRETDGDFDTPMDETLLIYPADGDGAPVAAELGELYPTGCVWSRDSATLYVTGDWQGALRCWPSTRRPASSYAGSPPMRRTPPSARRRTAATSTRCARRSTPRPRRCDSTPS